MPKARRSSTAEAPAHPDDRPAFARPPGAKRHSRQSSASPEKGAVPESPRRHSRPKAKQSPATTPVRRSHDAAKRHSGSPVKSSRHSSPLKEKAKYNSGTDSSQSLSVDALTKLNALNEKTDLKAKEVHRRDKGRGRDKAYDTDHEAARRKRKKDRYASAAVLEEGRARKGKPRGKSRHRGLRGGGSVIYERLSQKGGANGSKKRRCICLVAVLVLLLLIILIPVGVLVIGKKNGSSGSSSTTTKSGLPDKSTIPQAAQGTVLDPYTWLDTTDFNTTYTDATVGGLSIMGLNLEWDDSAKANDGVPALDQEWKYGQRPIRGVNVGGWLNLEPFMTPSMFQSYTENDGVIDEWTLTKRLGPTLAAQILEKHYANHVTEDTFKEIAEAGLDHVRIPYGYWAVTTYDGDPFVPKISWRYLLRGIEWARKYGLRVNLDLHGLPGSQNGWNHSGRQGVIGWLNGTDGSLNAQRSLDIHDQLSKFFAQDRYKNVVTIYGLVNEPKMMSLPMDTVIDWNVQAVNVIRKNGLDKYLAFGDGFLSLASWKGKFQDVDPKLVMDTHQYMIFNTGQIAFTHKAKISLACDGWSGLLSQSQDKSNGWGPVLCGEWSQADTDCTPNLNNVNVGSRWTGTLNLPDPSMQVLTPTCPTKNSQCSCTEANANPSQYSDVYKRYLLMLAESQMHSFEQVWGWFYWSWDTERAYQWSYKQGRDAGILPQVAGKRDWNCDGDIPDWESEGLPEYY